MAVFDIAGKEEKYFFYLIHPKLYLPSFYFVRFLLLTENSAWSKDIFFPQFSTAEYKSIFILNYPSYKIFITIISRKQNPLFILN